MMKFNEKYNHDNFLDFLEGFLPEDFTEKEEDIVINKERYKEITVAKVLGFSEVLGLHVLEMDHNKENDPRISIATDAFKILADHWIHKALVVFKNKESENYRLSYLTISLDINDKNKAVKKYSNARRYSFYLGTNAKLRTPEQQLIKKGRVKDTEDLLSRFSVEVVNKQFYLEVAKYFDELVLSEDKNLILPDVSQADINTRKSFAVRLIGRTMFCWFLKQKKTDNGQLVPDELLSSQAVSDDYYHNILEPLFFGVLNTAIESRDIRSDLFDKVPYLNGGLFNPQHDDYYELDRGTFTSKHINTLAISDTWFKGFFELLETYNFTIDENTIFDQELSVDPEMLGRIFENLLAEINPETGSSERKRTGSFYTPRQIVEYMVDQSLIEYLKTKTSIDEQKLSALISYDLIDDQEYPLGNDEKQEIIGAIESLKILDPACGSGAYPIGALQKIVYILQQIDPDCILWLEKKLNGVPDLYKQKIINEVKSNPFDYTRKLDVIKNSIFGVDIQPIAVDVSRLRCFLTLVVESEIDDTKQNRGIEPLPNLDFKFVCANTLIGLPKTENIGLFEDHSGITELSKIMSEYFSCNSQRKNEIKLKFTNTQKDILGKTILKYGKTTGDLTLKLTSWNPFDNKSNSWFDPEWMFGLEEKFGIVIGNPPYVRQEKIPKDFKSKMKELFPSVANGTADLYVYFFCAGISFLRKDGVLSYITLNKYLKTKYGRGLRLLLAENNIIRIIDFFELPVFEASTDVAITLIKKQKPNNNTQYYPIYSLDQMNKNNVVSGKSLGLTIDGMDWTFINDEYISIINKIKTNTISLGDFVDNKIYSGIKTALNQAFVLNQDDAEILLKTESAELIKKYAKSTDIQRWDLKNKNNYFLASGYDLDLYTKYPSAYKFLLKYELLLKQRLDQGKNWWNLRPCSYYEAFERNKIIYIHTAKKHQFYFDSRGYYVNNSCYLISTESKYLLCFLNSKLFCWFKKIIFVAYGNAETSGRVKLDYNKMVSIPVKKVSEEVEQKFAKLYTEGERNTLNQTLVREIENKIDELVMDLYGLNEEEKEIIRNS